jgi:ribosomal protein S18 acetylase RimI-like enzyme
MTPRIRRATTNDLGTLVALEKACFRSDGFSRRQFRYLLASATVLALVDDTSPCDGYAVFLCRPGQKTARLYSLAVRPSARRGGLAGRLMAEGEAWLKRRKYRKIFLEVRADHAKIIAFYAKHGYRPLRHVADYYENNRAALKMVKDLSPSRT